MSGVFEHRQLKTTLLWIGSAQEAEQTFMLPGMNIKWFIIRGLGKNSRGCHSLTVWARSTWRDSGAIKCLSGVLVLADGDEGFYKGSMDLELLQQWVVNVERKCVRNSSNMISTASFPPSNNNIPRLAPPTVKEMLVHARCSTDVVLPAASRHPIHLVALITVPRAQNQNIWNKY